MINIRDEWITQTFMLAQAPSRFFQPHIMLNFPSCGRLGSEEVGDMDRRRPSSGVGECQPTLVSLRRRI